MIRLNRIFGRRPMQDHDPQTGPAPQSAYSPPGTEEDWDDDLADAYLLAQEQGAVDGPAPALQPEPMAAVGPVAGSRPTEPLRDDIPMQDRVAMAQEQLAAAQGNFAPAFDLSSSTGFAPEPAGRRVGRVKTRLLGFEHAIGDTPDPFDAARVPTPAVNAGSCPVGWIVVIRGPGRGAHFALYNGVSQIGRGEDQAIKLDFGDGSISRSNHAAVAYDDETNGFFLGHGGKANIVRLNDRPVISTEPLASLDKIRIGETTLLFVALCGEGFRWSTDKSGTTDFG